MPVIELSRDDDAALKAKATAAGLTLEAWLKQLGAEKINPANRESRRHISEIIRENMSRVAPEIMETMPKDGASQHDHYIYGWLKRQV